MSGGRCAAITDSQETEVAHAHGGHTPALARAPQWRRPEARPASPVRWSSAGDVALLHSSAARLSALGLAFGIRPPS